MKLSQIFNPTNLRNNMLLLKKTAVGYPSVQKFIEGVVINSHASIDNVDLRSQFDFFVKNKNIIFANGADRAFLDFIVSRPCWNDVVSELPSYVYFSIVFGSRLLLCQV